jgi:hypothetical protein
MKKKLTHVILAAILAFGAIVSMFPKAATANAASVNNKVILFNSRAAIFSNAVLNAQGVLGNNQILVLTAGMLGVSINDLNTEFGAFNLPIDQFVILQVLAHMGNVPPQFIFNRLESGLSLGQISLIINAPFRLVLFNIDNFASVFTNQVAIATGQLTNDQVIAAFNAALDNLNQQFTVFATTLTPTVFNALVIRRLAFETGFTASQIRTALLQLINTGTTAMISAAVIAVSTTLAVQPTPFVNGTMEELIAPLINRTAIITNFNENGVPVTVFNGRSVSFVQEVATTMNA